MVVCFPCDCSTACMQCQKAQCRHSDILANKKGTKKVNNKLRQTPRQLPELFGSATRSVVRECIHHRGRARCARPETQRSLLAHRLPLSPVTMQTTFEKRHVVLRTQHLRGRISDRTRPCFPSLLMCRQKQAAHSSPRDTYGGHKFCVNNTHTHTHTHSRSKQQQKPELRNK